MRLKDHYKTLGLAPSASQYDIKKAYRQLVMRYHPDKNPDNSFALAHFKELQEAYATLSHNSKRSQYDEERWLSGMGNRMREQQVISPEWILLECIKLHKHIASIDTHRMSHGLLNEYIFMLLSDSHIAVLQHYADIETNSKIVSILLNVTNVIKASYLDNIYERLILLAGADEKMVTAINTNLNDRKKKELGKKYLPLVVVIITILLCLFMYYYGKRP